MKVSISFVQNRSEITTSVCKKLRFPPLFVTSMDFSILAYMVQLRSSVASSPFSTRNFRRPELHERWMLKSIPKISRKTSIIGFPKKQDGLLTFVQDYGSEHYLRHFSHWTGSRTPCSWSFYPRRLSRLILLLGSVFFLNQYFNITQAFSIFVPDQNLKLFKLSEYRDLVAHRLSGAVKIPTITYDEMGLLGKDERWNIFYDMAEYLEASFPRM